MAKNPKPETATNGFAAEGSVADNSGGSAETAKTTQSTEPVSEANTTEVEVDAALTNTALDPVPTDPAPVPETVAKAAPAPWNPDLIKAVVLDSLDHDGKAYGPGDEIKLDEDTFLVLARAGVVGL